MLQRVREEVEFFMRDVMGSHIVEVTVLEAIVTRVVRFQAPPNPDQDISSIPMTHVTGTLLFPNTYIPQCERIWPSPLEAISGARFPMTAVDRTAGVAASTTELAVSAMSSSRGIRPHGPYIAPSWVPSVNSATCRIHLTDRAADSCS